MNKKKRARIRKIPVKKMNTTISKKLVGLFIAAILALVGLSVRITYINVVSGDSYKRMVLQNTQQQYVNKTIPFKRGDILDRNGTILATSERVYNLILDCKVVNYTTTNDDGEEIQPYLEPTIALVVEMFGVDEDEIREKLTSEATKESQYQVIKQNVTMEEKEAYEARTDTTDENLTDEEYNERLNYNGIWFEETYKRVYPQNSLACDVIGFCSGLNEASYGIEGYYNDTLNGSNGRSFGYFNSDSDVEQTIIQATDGNNIVSTIDVNIQGIIREAIQTFQSEYQNGPNGTEAATNVAALVMDPNAGEILGMDSSDWYDLNNPQDLSSFVDAETLEAMTDEEKMEELSALWRNYCISDAYEPGSTVKPFTLAAALETDSVKTTDTFECDGYGVVNDTLIRCAVFPDYHGTLDAGGVVEQSCNDGMMQIAEKLGKDNFLKYQNIFGFGSKTGIDLPAESPGIVYDSDSMGNLELATSSFGQGYTCTMVQEAAAMCSLINGGYYYVPHVVKTITDSDGNLVESTESVVKRQTVSSSISDYIRGVMQETVESGTGTDAKVAGYSMGGKTGTAQKIPRDSGNYLVSFIGFAPADDPQLLIYVIVDQPNVEDQGTSVYAQQIAKNILTELLPYMNIFPDEEVTTDTAATDTTEQTTEDASVQSADTQTTDTGEAGSAQEVSEEAAVQETEAQTDESASEESADGSPPEDETQAENTQ